MIEQAARMVIQSLKSDPPAGIVVDLSQVTYFGSVFVSFLLRCHSQARKHGSEIVLAGASEPARELLETARPRNPVGDLRHAPGSDRSPGRLRLTSILFSPASQRRADKTQRATRPPASERRG